VKLNAGRLSVGSDSVSPGMLGSGGRGGSSGNGIVNEKPGSESVGRLRDRPGIAGSGGSGGSSGIGNVKLNPGSVSVGRLQRLGMSHEMWYDGRERRR
jgi:hypothetical protein